MKILLLSSYHTDSHANWAAGLTAHLTTHQWHVLTLPPRFFRWRIRGNPLSWHNELLEIIDQQFDCIIATSMVDLATIKGITPQLSLTPSIVYFHENQLAYPLSDQHQSIDPAMVNIYSALSATRVCFNSEYNRQSFLAGLKTLMKKLPDHTPSHLAKIIDAKSIVLPVPLSVVSDKRQQRKPQQALKIVWNHRWEYDKGPDRLLAFLIALEQVGRNYEIAIVGRQFRSIPTAMQEIKKRFCHRISHVGYIECMQTYRQILSSADIALSTAIHEFQGLALLEAIQHGCLPLAPHRLAYSELFTDSFLYASHLDNEAAEAKAAVEKLLELTSLAPMPPDVSHLQWQRLKTDYQQLIDDCVRQC